MFANSGELGSHHGARPEMSLRWRYGQPVDSLASDLSMDAGPSVASLNPILNGYGDAQPGALPQGLKNIKTEPLSHRPDCAQAKTLVKQTQPTPEEYRQYIKKLHMQNIQNQQQTPSMQPSEWQPPAHTMMSPQEEMAPATPVTIETVVYHQELDENGEWYVV